MYNVYFLLGGYKVTDSPNPRGEIVIAARDIERGENHPRLLEHRILDVCGIGGIACLGYDVHLLLP